MLSDNESADKIPLILNFNKEKHYNLQRGKNELKTDDSNGCAQAILCEMILENEPSDKTVLK